MDSHTNTELARHGNIGQALFKFQDHIILWSPMFEIYLRRA